MSRKGVNGDGNAARIAAQQHGVLSLLQLKQAGLSADSVLHRARMGRLYRVHQGVYALGHPALNNEGRWMAAVLACGTGAVLSHRSAAVLWGLLSVKSGPVDITVPVAGGRRKRSGIRIYRSPSVISCVTRRSNIPVTTVARTIADLRRTAPPAVVRRAVRQAQLAGFRIDDGSEVGHRTGSDLEDEFLRICRRHGLPAPEVNVKIGGLEVDFFWRSRSLVIELDTYRYHGTPSAFETDRARDARLKRLGIEVLRFTDRQLTQTRPEVVATLRALLAPLSSP